jgi:Ca2+-binding RTX toxin-like protein
MAIYQRSDVPFSDNLFTLPLTGDSSGDFWTLVLNSNFTTLLAAAIGGVITNPNLNLPDGSILTLQGTFTVTFGGTTADISGTITGLSRTTAGMIIETVSGFSLPFTAHYDALNSANNSSSAPTLQDIINGNDQLNGGSQDDLLMGFGGADTFNGAGGTDTVSYEAAPTAVRADLGNSATNTGTDAVGDTYTSIENLTGSQFNDILVGNAQGNVLTGGLGTDTMIGGAGNDTYFVDNAGDAVTENPGEGTDTVNASINYGLTPNVENLTLSGSADLQGFGNGLANTITGNSGNNLLDGGASADTMAGGAGNDIYFVDNAGDAATENASEGNDTVFASANFTLSANVENLILQGSADLQGFGNGQANVIYGNAGNNLIDGGGGIDLMVGGAGNDTYFVDDPSDAAFEVANEGNDAVFTTTNYGLAANVETLVMQGSADLQGYGSNQANVLYGNSGNNLLNGAGGVDLMVGGLGNDTYFVDDPSDSCFEVAGQGNDAVFASCNYGLAADVETLVMQGSGDFQGYGNNQVNTLYGNAGNNLINGAGGADTMLGGGGNDTYFVDNVGDVVVENSGEGTDAIFSTVAYTLSANVETLVLQGNGNINGTGNVIANSIVGNSGNNTLDGGAAADTLTGNAGNDTFVFRLGQGNGDTVVDFAGSGAAAGDSLQFVGYSMATFTNIDLTHWQVNYNLGMGVQHEIITFLNGASIDPTDYSFI